MDALKARILKDGKNLGNGILKVDSFINHQVDPQLMDECGRQLAQKFNGLGATKVLTAEISGIAPALTTAYHLGLPVVYARKHKPITISRAMMRSGFLRNRLWAKNNGSLRNRKPRSTVVFCPL